MHNLYKHEIVTLFLIFLIIFLLNSLQQHNWIVLLTIWTNETLTENSLLNLKTKNLCVNSKFTTSVYGKPIHTSMFTIFTSFISLIYKFVSLYLVVLKYFLMTLFFESIFKYNGYTDNFIGFYLYHFLINFILPKKSTKAIQQTR